MKKQLSVIPSILFLFILLTFFYLLTIERNPSGIPSNLLDKNIPNFETESLLKNEKFISSREFGKEILLVNFFATWCKPCRDEHVYIKRFSNEKGLRIIGINIQLDVTARGPGAGGGGVPPVPLPIPRFCCPGQGFLASAPPGRAPERVGSPGSCRSRTLAIGAVASTTAPLS